ncbi:AraC family transcriptional regulator [Clostridium cellulovorans]|uniref:Transcriptional regulator, AraC family n=1 Tax=Clostridium cellulovorans (strain ATCC 35296 / DSM 3052 / OCM 3 / 743B) TaxID=573061 RepID=D9STZ0_CLOC7|nr:AraC family transcriptional regulator [Clostridium cellulovorans]ADL50828.1 transcriptional regulator, AraC family [Clostridium cellulovorans 743B]
MDTLENMKNAIDYIENNLNNEIEYAKIAQIALCSQYHFQRMFGFLIGVPLSEYIRRRRLTLAAFDLQNSNEKIIDIALKYGYTSPDSFSRAFMAVHGINPSKARENGISLKAYPRVTFSLSLKGVVEMNYRIEKKNSFTIVGVKERFSHLEGLGENIGRMWSETSPETFGQIAELGDTEPYGLLGVYSGMYEDNTTDYYIATTTTKSCPETLSKLEIPSLTWAVFEITGPMPTAMSEVWGRIFSEWFPTSGYEHAEAPEVEWYSKGDLSATDYKSEIWIPVIKK